VTSIDGTTIQSSPDSDGEWGRGSQDESHRLLSLRRDDQFSCLGNEGQRGKFANCPHIAFDRPLFRLAGRHMDVHGLETHNR